MPIRSILFDLDGTLTDPKVGITRSLQFALEQMGLPAPSMEELLWCIGPPLKQSLAQLVRAEGEPLERALGHYRARFSTVGLFENAVYPEIPETLERLKGGGFRLFLATSKPHVFARRILDHFALTRFFEAIHGSELDGSLADKGELIASILQRESLDPVETVMVGDRLHDIVGGKKNGMATAGVSYGYGGKEELQAAGADWIFETPRALGIFFSEAF